jgi:hypothetical protein
VFLALAMMAATQLAPGCHNALFGNAGSAKPVRIVECYLRHEPDHTLLIINDGVASNTVDAGDVLIGVQVNALYGQEKR